MGNFGKIILCVIVLAAGIGAWEYYHAKDSTADSKSGKGGKNANGAPVPVGVATAKTGNIDVYLDGLGNVTPRATITVQSRVTGELMRVLYHEGQLIKAGALLAEIDVRPYQAVLLEAQGLLIRDTALLKEARIDLQRYKTLWAQDSIAKQQLDLQASLVKQYEGTVRNDEGQVAAAKVNVDYCRITSPVTGRVGLRLVDPGNIITTAATTGIVIVTELQPITVIFTIPEDDIPAVTQYVEMGKKLPVDAWDRDNKHKLASGQLYAIDNEVDPTTGTVKFRSVFANKNNALFPSQFVNVRLLLTTKENVVLAPTASIQRGTQGTFVYLVKDNQVKVQPVTLGTSEGESVEITKGISAGDEVVVDGGDSLRDGSKIEIASLDGVPTKQPAKGEKAGDKGDKSETKEKQKKHKKSSDSNE